MNILDLMKIDWVYLGGYAVDHENLNVGDVRRPFFINTTLSGSHIVLTMMGPIGRTVSYLPVTDTSYGYGCWCPLHLLPEKIRFLGMMSGNIGKDHDLDVEYYMILTNAMVKPLVDGT